MPNLFESNAAGERNFSFEGHCAMANADDANEVQTVSNDQGLCNIFF